MKNERIIDEGDIVRPDVEVLGDTFYQTENDGFVYVHHPRWSICGMGPTLTDAVKDTIKEAHIARQHFCAIPVSGLTADAVEFRQWLEARP